MEMRVLFFFSMTFFLADAKAAEPGYLDILNCDSFHLSAERIIKNSINRDLPNSYFSFQSKAGKLHIKSELVGGIFHKLTGWEPMKDMAVELQMLNSSEGSNCLWEVRHDIGLRCQAEDIKISFFSGAKQVGQIVQFPSSARLVFKAFASETNDMLDIRNLDGRHWIDFSRLPGLGFLADGTFSSEGKACKFSPKQLGDTLRL